MKKNITEALLKFIDVSKNAILATENEEEILKASGFKELKRDEVWDIKAGEGYFLSVGGTSVIAFRIGEDYKSGFNIIGSHNDSPTFRIKDNALAVKEGLKTLNVEPYGGAIYRTWLDRNLSIAGRLILKDKGKIKSRTFSVDRSLMLIPSLAIHMDREVNKAGEIKPQSLMIPFYGMEDEDKSFKDFLARELDINKDDIITGDIFLNPVEKGEIWGENNEFFSSARIDNLQMAYLSLVALTKAKTTDKTQVIVITDNEEIGSGTLSGANSSLLRDTLERIAVSLGMERQEFLISLSKSFMISADGAHAVHPLKGDVADPTNRPKLNKGPVVKIASSRSYATVAETYGRFSLLAEAAGVEIQTFYNHSDRRGGSTIGPVSERLTGIPSVDVGNAMLAMHSARETAGVKDNAEMLKIFEKFFS